MKQRLDVALTERGLADSRARARALILAGEITVNGQTESKAGALVGESATIALRAGLPYASRGGLKLAHALDAFALAVGGRVALDVGASTGGFTDCLLQRGAARVYAVDVGYGQLDWKLRTDSRVVVVERTNIRYLESLPEQPDLAVVDVSFISLRLVLPVIYRLCSAGRSAWLWSSPSSRPAVARWARAAWCATLPSTARCWSRSSMALPGWAGDRGGWCAPPSLARRATSSSCST